MDKSSFIEKLDYFNMVNGVTLRAIAAFGDENLDYRPQPSMRSPKELIFHIYTQEKVLVEAAKQGQLTAEAANSSNPESESVAAEVKALTTMNDVQEYAKTCHQTAEQILRAMSEEELTRAVGSPYGTFPAWKYFDFAYDEHWHHRGQLYTYLRLLGKEPLMVYDY
jgi:uncharacterized damage-inducible protein DinB